MATISAENRRVIQSITYDITEVLEDKDKEIDRLQDKNSELACEIDYLKGVIEGLNNEITRLKLEGL